MSGKRTGNQQCASHSRGRQSRGVDYDQEIYIGSRLLNDIGRGVKEAKAAREKALGAIKIEKAKASGTSAEVSEARREAKKDTMDANYQADKEKCDAMSGDAQDKCISDTKAKYGK